MSLETRFADSLGQLIGPDFPDQIGLAVSGGGDSMAMLTLAHNWAHRWGVRLWVATVDHGLRAEAAQEAAMVARECRDLGHPHAVLRWQWDGQGNVMDRARRARQGLINRWRGGLRHVLFAHTRDDLAEGFLMRLQRGAGVNGLAAMQPCRFVTPDEVPGEITGDCPKGIAQGGFYMVRPCLGMGRDELRFYLKTLQGQWVEDPTNDDPHYDRARMRQLLTLLQEHGLGVDVLAGVANRMADAKQSLRQRALEVWERIGREDPRFGTLTLSRDGLAQVERETQLRILSAALLYVSGADYGPRAEKLQTLLDRVLAGGSATLHGVDLRVDKDSITVLREYNVLRNQKAKLGDGQLWDGRWHLHHDTLQGHIRALGDDGWQQIREKSGTCPPYHIARTLPALWQNDQVVACDGVLVETKLTTCLYPRGKERFQFNRFVLSH